MRRTLPVMMESRSSAIGAWLWYERGHGWQAKTHSSALFAKARQGQRGRLITGIPVVHQTAKRHQAAHALERHLATYGLQGEVDPGTLRQAHDFRLEVLGGVVDRGISSQAPRQFQLGLGGCRSNAPEIPLLAQLEAISFLHPRLPPAPAQYHPAARV